MKRRPVAEYCSQLITADDQRVNGWHRFERGSVPISIRTNRDVFTTPKAIYAIRRYHSLIRARIPYPDQLLPLIPRTTSFAFYWGGFRNDRKRAGSPPGRGECGSGNQSE